MTDHQLKLWKQIYLLSGAIADLEPWRYFKEDDALSCVLEERKTALFFSFLLEGRGQYGIACYVGEGDYIDARRRLTGPNPKKEPVFFLQNAIIGLWGDREEVSASGRQVIKELGLKCRGKGSWLHFDSYRTGCIPGPLDDTQLELLCAGLGPLYTMVQAVVEKGQSAAFDRGEFLVWRSSQPERLFRANRADLPGYEEPADPGFIVRDDDMVFLLKSVPSRLYAVELDWGYLDFVMRNGRKKFYPRFLLAVDAASSFIYCARLVNPYEDHAAFLLDALTSLIAEHGKPKKLYLCDPELAACLGEFCEKIDLPIVMKKSLSQTTWARKTFWEKIFGSSEYETADRSLP